MRTRLYTLILALTTLASCTTSTETSIKKAFKDYVQNNFDDPRALKEIISITPNDTVSTAKFKEMALNLIAIGDSTRLNKEKVDSMWTELAEEIGGMSRWAREQVKDDVVPIIQRRYFSVRNELALSQAEILNKATLKDAMEQIPHKAPMYGYLIKCRIQDGNGRLKLTEFHAYIDSLSQNIAIYKDDIGITEYCPELEHAKECLTKYSISLDSYSDTINESLEDLEKARYSIDLHGVSAGSVHPTED